jgi:hypothetical protein
MGSMQTGSLYKYVVVQLRRLIVDTGLISACCRVYSVGQ